MARAAVANVLHTIGLKDDDIADSLNVDRTGVIFYRGKKSRTVNKLGYHQMYDHLLNFALSCKDPNSIPRRVEELCNQILA